MHFKQKSICIMLSCLVFLLPCFSSEAFACTLIGMAGDDEVLIGKNRDRKSDFVQSLIRVKPVSGYQYIGLKRIGSNNIVSGINMAGLAVVMAKPYKIKVKGVGKILAACASVEEVLNMAKRGEIGSPMIILAADRNAVLLLEHYNKETFQYKKISKGCVAATNHFTFKFMEDFIGQKPGLSSVCRYDRANEMLGAFSSYDLEKMESILSDNKMGKTSLSIARFAVKKNEERTIASTILSIKKGGDSTIRVLFGNPVTNSYINISFNDRIPKSFEDGTIDRINKKLTGSYFEHLISSDESKEISKKIGEILLKATPSFEREFCEKILKLLEEKDIEALKKFLMLVKENLKIKTKI